VLRILAVCSIVPIAAWAAAQAPVKIDLPSSGNFVAFSSKGVATTLPEASATAVAGIGVIVSVNAGDDTVNVLDRAAGNIASIPIKKIKGDWKPTPADFTRAAEVMVHVEGNGGPATSAEVELNDGSKRSPVMLDSAANGDASFVDVRGGKDTVTIHYRDAKGATQQTVQEFELDQTRTTVIPKWTVALADAPASAPPAKTPAEAAPAAAQPPAKPAPQPANPVGSILVELGAIALAVGVGYGIMRYFKNNPGPITEKLEQLGVQIPKAGSDPISSPAPYVPQDPVAKAQPPQKIILNDAAPDPIVNPMPSPVPSYAPSAVAAPAVASPSLVTDQGVVLPLADGETTVGRDVGLGLSLAAETTVSRRHASLTKNGADVTVQDLGSTNGTFVNGARVQTPVSLHSGDAVQFGSVKFVYRA